MTVSLDDKYQARSGSVYLTGSQALVRLPIMQSLRDKAQGLKTAGFISGYRGSPLGIYDLALWQAQPFLEQHNIRFQPGINEDLAATAVWGTQQVGQAVSSSYDGVFAMWYGKGPGVDRSGDPLKHGSIAGTARHGGVLALCGDDHAARSSTIAHQSDHALIHFGMPIFNPANVQDFLDLGLAGFALSRFAGTWLGFKCITDTVETSARVDVSPERLSFREPEDFETPDGGLNLILGMMPLVAESRHFDLRMDAVKAFARANQINRQIMGIRGRRRLGIVATGKALLDVQEAMRLLDLDDAAAKQAGIALYKLGMSWPVEPDGMRDFVAGCDEVLVVEEKRGIVEEQLAHLLYNLPADSRPVLSGKCDPSGAPLLPQTGECTPAIILKAIRARLLASELDVDFRARLEGRNSKASPADLMASAAGLVRSPSFCAGCPHNISTNVPDGSVAMGGIGCHGLATWLPERRTVTLYHMGGEGAAWIGQAPFSEVDHIFQNLGDGTYFHSGLLAIRACVASKVNITYKILLNGVIAMTGGQPIEGESFDGAISAPHIASQLVAEGVKKVAVVADDPSRHNLADFPPNVSFHHRDELDEVQRIMREVEGVSAIIYDQACATERRRMRKRGRLPDPDRRLFIVPEVCEGCGDCGLQSNCVAIEPEETALGRKRRINQSVCNKDYSCVKGLCPSFVTVEGGTPRKAATALGLTDADIALPEPQMPTIDGVYSLMIAGIGGNGVVTIGAILGMAAHIAKVGVTVLDVSGLAQRNGPVTSHIRLTSHQSQQHAARIPEGGADAVIGCDLVVCAGGENLAKMAHDQTRLVYNRFVAPTSAFATNPDLDFNADRLASIIAGRIGEEALTGIEATKIAIARLGDAIGANMLLVGHAWQNGLIPLPLHAIEQAIRLNGAAIELNLEAFRLGRISAVDAQAQARWFSEQGNALEESEDLCALISHCTQLLHDFDGPARAQRYRSLVAKAAEVECGLNGERGDFTRQFARGYFKALYFKDEYEVARLFADGDLERRLAEVFDGDLKLKFNLAPPIFSRRGADGRERKREFGSWMLRGFHLLARLRGLRGSAFDIFGKSAHRRAEQALGDEYAAMAERLFALVDSANLNMAAQIAGAYAEVKGFGAVKQANLGRVREEVAAGLARLEEGSS